MKRILLAALLIPLPVFGATTEALVTAMIEAHGGYEAWSKAPTCRFTETWEIPGAPAGTPIGVTVEQTSRRAYLEDPGAGSLAVWDGEKAWSVNWQSPMPPRFVALLNYYFTNLPWLIRDPGVVLGEPGTGSLPDDPASYHTIRMTFEAGTGDTPDDYYVLYIHPETHELAACEYIVTYAALLPEGVTHSPPHLLVYGGHAAVNGLKVPGKFTIYEEGRLYAACTFEDWSFSEPFDASRMAMPEGAVVDTSSPTR